MLAYTFVSAFFVGQIMIVVFDETASLAIRELHFVYLTQNQYIAISRLSFTF